MGIPFETAPFGRLTDGRPARLRFGRCGGKSFSCSRPARHLDAEKSNASLDCSASVSGLRIRFHPHGNGCEPGIHNEARKAFASIPRGRESGKALRPAGSIRNDGRIFSQTGRKENKMRRRQDGPDRFADVPAAVSFAGLAGGSARNSINRLRRAGIPRLPACS